MSYLSLHISYPWLWLDVADFYVSHSHSLLLCNVFDICHPRSRQLCVVYLNIYHAHWWLCTSFYIRVPGCGCTFTSIYLNRDYACWMLLTSTTFLIPIDGCGCASPSTAFLFLCHHAMDVIIEGALDPLSCPHSTNIIVTRSGPVYHIFFLIVFITAASVLSSVDI